MMDGIVSRLLESEEPAVRYKTLVNVLGREPEEDQCRLLRQEIKESARARALLSGVGPPGEMSPGPYRKWTGAHWALADLADIGYPPGDERLLPLRQQIYDWLFGEEHQARIRKIAGLTRRCASQEGNALLYLLALGLADERCDELARKLLTWQWPDGGWNCDVNAAAHNSSYMESLIPLRALALHARLTGNPESRAAAGRAADIFLKRRLFRRQADGGIIHKDFVVIHYPCYYHYDFLFGLKVLAEAGFAGDPRCADALDLLESKRLPDGGFPAERAYYRVSDKPASGRSMASWGGVSKRRMNEWVTVDALFVLRESGRMKAEG
jgi:hypothetical protein